MNRIFRCFLCLVFTFTILFGSLGRAYAAPESYQVEKGDNLIFISESFYGNPFDYKKIYEANSDIIHDPDLIFIGQEFRLPGQEEALAENAQGKDKPAASGRSEDDNDEENPGNNTEPGGPIKEAGAAESGNPAKEAGAAESGNPAKETDASESGNPVKEAGGAESGNPAKEAGAAESGNPVKEAGGAESGNPAKETDASESGNPVKEAGAAESGNMTNEEGNPSNVKDAAEDSNLPGQEKPLDKNSPLKQESMEEGNSFLDKNSVSEEYYPVKQGDPGALTITVTNSTDVDLPRVMIGPRAGITHDDINVADTPLKPGETRVVSCIIEEEFMEEEWFSIFVYDDRGGNSPSYTFFEKNRTESVTISLSRETGRYSCRIS